MRHRISRSLLSVATPYVKANEKEKRESTCEIIVVSYRLCHKHYYSVCHKHYYSVTHYIMCYRHTLYLERNARAHVRESRAPLPVVLDPANVREMHSRVRETQTGATHRMMRANKYSWTYTVFKCRAHLLMNILYYSVVQYLWTYTIILVDIHYYNVLL